MTEPDWELIEQKTVEWNTLYDREGSCNRCGKCCYLYDPDTKTRKICAHLEFDGEGLAVCSVYGTEDFPCEDFPQYDDGDPYWIGCGYSWKEKV